MPVAAACLSPNTTKAGSEIMQRIAVPVIGGMVSSTVLTLIVIPAIYSLANAGQTSAVPHLTNRAGG